MAVKIRLTRMGSKKRPSYRIVATDSRSPRDGRYLEQIGFYNPLVTPCELKVDEKLALKWLRNGALPTDTAKNLLSQVGVMKKREQSNMELVDFTKELIVSIVSNKDLVEVRQMPQDESDTVVIEALVDKEDMPKVIGRGGRNINAIRTLVQAASYKKDNKHVKINVDTI